MTISSKFEKFYYEAKGNRWYRYFTVFCRVALAAGFIPSGIIKITGERFTSLSANHPMGHYLEALHQTGYYYTFIGIMQLTVALLLLIPRTATLGAILYLPIIVNICLLSFAVRFEGSLMSSPLMVLANIYLLCWDYDKLKFVLGRRSVAATPLLQGSSGNKFPWKFFAGTFATVVLMVLLILSSYKVMPRNTIVDCRQQFKGTNRTTAGYRFCDCIHNNGQPLDKCLKEYRKAPDDSVVPPTP
jgi:uncharacterized membrane protein YphA (DoxX/SURF4 family)